MPVGVISRQNRVFTVAMKFLKLPKHFKHANPLRYRKVYDVNDNNDRNSEITSHTRQIRGHFIQTSNSSNEHRLRLASAQRRQSRPQREQGRSAARATIAAMSARRVTFKIHFGRISKNPRRPVELARRPPPTSRILAALAAGRMQLPVGETDADYDVSRGGKRLFKRSQDLRNVFDGNDMCFFFNFNDHCGSSLL